LRNPGTSEDGGERGETNEGRMERRQRAHARQHHHGLPMLRLEIPLFNGSGPRWWIRRCERAFKWYGVEERQKVTIASAYLNDVGDAWFQRWSKVREECRWEEFTEEFYERFGDRGMADIVEEFNKLQQLGTVLEYQVRFEELKAVMLIHNPYLTKAYFVSSFINGLSEELRPMVKVLQPRTLKHAADSVRLHELTVEALMKKKRQVAKGVQQGSLQLGRGFTREVGRSVKGPPLPAPTDLHGRMIE